MKVEKVNILGVRDYEDKVGFALGWEDDSGYFGIIDFSQAKIGDKITIDSESMGKDFIFAVLQALVENAEIKDDNF